MSRTRHSKKKFKQKVDHIREARQQLADATDVTVLSTLKEALIKEKKAATDLTRHPKGTKASGGASSIPSASVVLDAKTHLMGKNSIRLFTPSISEL
jgi:hypothetical protein